MKIYQKNINLFTVTLLLFLFVSCSNNIPSEYRGEVYTSEISTSSVTYGTGYRKSNTRKVFLHFNYDGDKVNLYDYWLKPNGGVITNDGDMFDVVSFSEDDDRIDIELKIQDTQMVRVDLYDWEEKETPKWKIDDGLKLTINKSNFKGIVKGLNDCLQGIPVDGLEIFKSCDEFINSSNNPNCNPDKYLLN